MNGTTSTMIIVAVCVVLAIIVIVAVAQRNRSASLQKRFGPEYDRAVRETGSRKEAEDELARRQDRVKKMHIGELPPGAKARYDEEWRTVQTRFVDDPKAAISGADRLISNVMRDRGYPQSDFDQSVADLSPDHPDVIKSYRTAHTITLRSEHGEASTEDLREAMVCYRNLFEDLVHDRK